MMDESVSWSNSKGTQFSRDWSKWMKNHSDMRNWTYGSLSDTMGFIYIYGGSFKAPLEPKRVLVNPTTAILGVTKT